MQLQSLGSSPQEQKARATFEIRGLTKYFFKETPQGWAALPVLDNISLSAGESEFVSILGPSGCGKTTLARIIMGIEQADEGEILVDGKPAGKPGTDRSLVLQNYGLLPWRTVVQNVELGLELQGRPERERQEIARKYINLVGLDKFEHYFPHQISGGMQQRAGLARALSTGPRILIMDEPFAALDAQMRERLQDEVLRICELTKTTILFVTHSLDEAVYMSDRILVFSARPGRVKADVKVDLPKPRYRTDLRSQPRFAELRQHVRELLGHSTEQRGIEIESD